MINGTVFEEFAIVCAALEGTTKRNVKKLLIGTFLLKLEEEISSALSFLIGRPFPESDSRNLGIGYGTILRALRTMRQSTMFKRRLTIMNVDTFFAKISSVKGKGARKKKIALIQILFAQARPLEEKYLKRILMGEMRIGVVEGVVLESISEAAGVPLELVQRANMLRGNIGDVARIALKGGIRGLEEIGIRLFTPIKPMLAAMIYEMEEVFKSHGEKIALEYKFDGARIQVHLKGEKVRIFSRRLIDVTPSLPDLVKIVREKIRAEDALLEGEVIAINIYGKVLPFQDLMRRFRRVHKVEDSIKMIPLKLLLFDVLYLNGETLIDTSYEKRREILIRICDKTIIAEGMVAGSPSEVEVFLDSALRAGHEGLIARARP